MELPMPAAQCPPRRPAPSPPPPPPGDPPGGGGGVSVEGRPPPPASSIWPLSAATPQPETHPALGPSSAVPPPQPRWRWLLFGMRPPLSATAAAPAPTYRYGRRPYSVWVACLAALSAAAVANAVILLHHAAIRCYHPVSSILVHVENPEPRRAGVSPPRPTYGNPRYYVRVRDLRGRPPDEEVEVPRYAPTVRYGQSDWTRRRRGRSGATPDAEFYKDLKRRINAPLVVYMSRAEEQPVLEPPGGYFWRRAVGWVTAGLAAASAGAAVALAVADRRGGGRVGPGGAAPTRRGGSFPSWWSSSGRGDGAGVSAEEDIVWMGDWVTWADAAVDGRGSGGIRDGGRSADGSTSGAGPSRPPRLAGAVRSVDDPGGGRHLGEPHSGGGGRRSTGLAAAEIEGVLATGAIRPTAFSATPAAADWSCAICLDGLPAGAAAPSGGCFPTDGGVGDDRPAAADDDPVGVTLAAVRSWVAAARRGSVAVPVGEGFGAYVRGAKGRESGGRRLPSRGGGLANGAAADDGSHGSQAGGGGGGTRLPRRLVCLPCTHVFHARCLRRWLVLGSTECPLCKRYVYRPKGSAAADSG